MDEGEEDVLAYMTFPQQHRTKLHSTIPVERLYGEIKRRTDVVGIFPNENAIRRMVGAIFMEQTEEWAVQRAHHMTLETLAPVCDTPPSSACQQHRSADQLSLAKTVRPMTSYTTCWDTVLNGLDPTAQTQEFAPLEKYSKAHPAPSERVRRIALAIPNDLTTQ